MPTLQLASLVPSLRSASFNRLTCETVRGLLGPDVTMTDIDIEAVPFYNHDVEAIADPEGVAKMKQIVASTDALIIFSPEYNSSMPGVLKNAIDWLSSSTGGASVLSTAAVALVATTPGRHEAAGLQDHLQTCVQANTKEPFLSTHVLNSIRHRLTNQSGEADLEGTILGGSALGDLDPLPGLEQWVRKLEATVRARTSA